MLTMMQALSHYNAVLAVICIFIVVFFMVFVVFDFNLL
jgi:hypothetical protein